jgi:hypothetical protein
MLTSNLSLIRKEVTKVGVGIDVASRKARDEMAMALQQLARNEIRRSGAAQAGGPPVNRTGNLRNSINTEKRTIGFANYKAIIGPQAVYGRILELGFPNGNKYPYMQPAYRKFQAVAPSIIKKHLSGRGF